MLAEDLVKICNEIKKAKSENFSAHPLAGFIRTNAVKSLKNSLKQIGKDFICKGSAGQGNWAEVPWLAVFDPLITSTATKGYYVVYLFHSTDPVVHLSLNQGTTAVRAAMVAASS